MSMALPKEGWEQGYRVGQGLRGGSRAACLSHQGGSRHLSYLGRGDIVWRQIPRRGKVNPWNVEDGLEVGEPPL